MVYDFGLTKLYIKELIDMFDHSVTLWSDDDPKYIQDIKRHSKRWVELPVSPSAEQFSRVIFLMVERVLECMEMRNGERDVLLHSIIVHETDTGYAQGFYDDAHSVRMGTISLHDIKLSEQVQSEWSDPNLWQHLLQKTPLAIPNDV